MDGSNVCVCVWGGDIWMVVTCVCVGGGGIYGW